MPTPRRTFTSTSGLVTGIVVSEKAEYLKDSYIAAFNRALSLYVETANTWVLAVFAKGYADVRDSLGKYFKSDDKSHYTQAMTLLRRTQVGMRGKQEIKIQMLPSAITGKVSGGFWGGKRRIHLDMLHFASLSVKKAEHLGAMLYLHEATHLYAGTDDYGDRGNLIYRDNAFQKAADPYREPGLTRAQALRNADSYAGFVYEAATAAP
jgi:hypothetical protein